MKELKEKTIPITLSKFACYSLITISIICLIGVLHFSQFIEKDGTTTIEEDYFALSATGLLIGGIFCIILCSVEWDLNPIHAIGYCLRWKKD